MYWYFLASRSCWKFCAETRRCSIREQTLICKKKFGKVNDGIFGDELHAKVIKLSTNAKLVLHIGTSWDLPFSLALKCLTLLFHAYPQMVRCKASLHAKRKLLLCCSHHCDSPFLTGYVVLTRRYFPFLNFIRSGQSTFLKLSSKRFRFLCYKLSAVWLALLNVFSARYRAYLSRTMRVALGIKPEQTFVIVELRV